MADFQDQDILDLQEDFEYDFGGDDLLGPRDQEEPMEQGYDSDVCILEEEESADPADPEEQNLFGCGGKDIFEQDDPAPSPQPSIYGMSQLLADVNPPTLEEDPEDIPSHSPATEAALQSVNLDWNEEVQQEAPSSPVLEEEVVEVGCY